MSKGAEKREESWSGQAGAAHLNLRSRQTMIWVIVFPLERCISTGKSGDFLSISVCKKEENLRGHGWWKIATEWQVGRVQCHLGECRGCSGQTPLAFLSWWSFFTSSLENSNQRQSTCFDPFPETYGALYIKIFSLSTLLVHHPGTFLNIIHPWLLFPEQEPLFVLNLHSSHHNLILNFLQGSLLVSLQESKNST